MAGSLLSQSVYCTTTVRGTGVPMIPANLHTIVHDAMPE